MSPDGEVAMTLRWVARHVAGQLRDLASESTPRLAHKLERLAAVLELPVALPTRPARACAAAGCDQVVPPVGRRGGRPRRYCETHRRSRAKPAPNPPGPPE